jgi:hypothetical protein
MTYFLLGMLIAIGAIVFLSSCKNCIETFQDCKMTPWFGYEPGYGPGWGRKCCCDVPVPPNMKSTP